MEEYVNKLFCKDADDIKDILNKLGYIPYNDKYLVNESGYFLDIKRMNNKLIFIKYDSLFDAVSYTVYDGHIERKELVDDGIVILKDNVITYYNNDSLRKMQNINHQIIDNDIVLPDEKIVLDECDKVYGLFAALKYADEIKMKKKVYKMKLN